MLDSIVFRVNNIGRYPNLINFLTVNARKEQLSAKASLPENSPSISLSEIGNELSKSEPNIERVKRIVQEGQESNKNLYFNLKLQMYHNEGKKLEFVDGATLTSSHYYLGWRMPLGDKLGYAEFNFSIPKLLYGTNVLQFVPHNTEYTNQWSYVNKHKYEWNQEITHERLVYFMERFFAVFFFNVGKIDLHDVEIRRIDICWNQYFNSKDEALRYLNYQKNVKKKNLRFNSRNKHSFSTSLFYSTRDYGAKIYHKGTEYRSSNGELKRHKEMNKLMRLTRDNWYTGKRRNVPYDTDKIAMHADRILRYEITFRNSFLSKIFRNKVFRCKNEEWQKYKALWKECHRIDSAATDTHNMKKSLREFWLAVYLGRVSPTNKEHQGYAAYYQYNFKSINLKVGLSKRNRDFYRWWSKERDRRMHFMLKVSDTVSDINRGVKKAEYMGGGIEHGLPYEAKFSPRLLNECFKIFNKFKDEFKIETRTDLSEAVNRADKYDRDVKEFNNSSMVQDGIVSPKKEIHLSKAKQLLALLGTYTWDQLIEKGLVSRWTANRWKEKFKMIDLHVNNAAPFKIWACEDFSEYHRSLEFEGMTKYLSNFVFR